MKKLMMAFVMMFFVSVGAAYAESVNLNDLKQYDPNPPSLKDNPPPPLPKPDKTPGEKIKETLQEKLQNTRPGPGNGAARG
ncbi:MAG: hypothetical protein WC878_03975 [Candidatus Paceibacterota bacterium]|jgi:hypothetical protein